MRRILGIDPGLRATGFGVIDRGERLRYVASGTIRSPEGLLPDRLKVLLLGIQQVIAEYQPQEVAIEQVFVNINPQSTLLLGQARGVVMAGALLAGLPVHEYTALQIKQSVVGHGHAAKEQVQMMVKQLLAIQGEIKPDAADGLACAICHVQHVNPAFAGLATRGLKVRRGRWA